MNTVRIPLVHELYLEAEKIEIPENRIVPTEVSNYGKVLKAQLLVKSRDHFILESISWGNTRLVSGFFIHHFHEIIIAYVHNRLRNEQEHLIFNKKEGYGVKLYYGKTKEHDLLIEVYDLKTNSFVFTQSFSKVECCIIVRVLNHYLHKGEIKEEDYFPGDVKCNYSGKSFTFKIPG